MSVIRSRTSRFLSNHNLQSHLKAQYSRAHDVNVISFVMIVVCKYVQNERNKKLRGPSCEGSDMRTWMSEDSLNLLSHPRMMKVILM